VAPLSKVIHIFETDHEQSIGDGQAAEKAVVVDNSNAEDIAKHDEERTAAGIVKSIAEPKVTSHASSRLSDSFPNMQPYNYGSELGFDLEGFDPLTGTSVLHCAIR
jgi:hypothetical protein